MEEIKFLYKCPNHIANLNNMRLSNKLCDVTIKINEKQLSAHKVILAANLKYFDVMFSTDSFQESKAGFVTMKDVNEADLEAFVSYAYTGEMLLTDSNALDLLELANYLGEDAIKHACVQFLEKHLRKEDACQAFQFASTIACPSLKDAAKTTILSNFEICSQTTEFLNFSYELLEDLFSNGKDQAKESQQKLFEGIVKWIMHDIEQRKSHMDGLLNLIDITKLTTSYLMNFLCENFVDQKDEHGIMRDVMFHYHRKNKNQQVEPQLTVTRQVLLVVRDSLNDFAFQICDLSRKKWHPVEKIPSSMFLISQSVILNDKIYFMGRNAAEQLSFCSFDLKTKQFTEFSSRIHKFVSSAMCTCSRFIYWCGGFKNMISVSDQVLRYDPQTNTLAQLAPMQTARSAAAAVFYKGCLHVFGGYNEGAKLHTVEKYDAVTNKWTFLSPMCEARRYHAVAILDEKLYACGGQEKSSVEVYDPSTNRWQLVASMKKTKRSFSVVAHEGKLLAIGGNEEITVEVYDPNKNQWMIDDELSSGLQVKYLNGGLVSSSCIFDAN